MEYYLNIAVLVGIAIMLSLCVAMGANEIRKIRESHKKEDNGRAELMRTIQELRSTK